jgi:hypothetical protein
MQVADLHSKTQGESCAAHKGALPPSEQHLRVSSTASNTAAHVRRYGNSCFFLFIKRVSWTHIYCIAQSAARCAGKWELLQLLDRSLTAQQELGATDKDTDDVIRLLAGVKPFACSHVCESNNETTYVFSTETPLWLLGLTFVVSIIHLLFDILAIKSDIMFWNSAQRREVLYY